MKNGIINFFRKIVSIFIVITFIFSLITPPQALYAQVAPQNILNLPIPGTMVYQTSGFNPVLVEGLTIHPENPLLFDFIVTSGDSGLDANALQNEANKLIKYFLASLTVPEKEMWVNLSPYEQNRIIPKGFGDTEMGRDLLAQDYMLKQLTASLMYPEEELGQKFWNRVYTRAQEEFGTTQIPVNTFNKIWIVPEKAVVYEHEESAFVVESYLKVMLEEDYVALQENIKNDDLMPATASSNDFFRKDDVPEMRTSELTSKIIKEVLIPEIEKEVNEGEIFANLRQIYNSMILATWYKQNLKQSLLGQVYVDQNKTKGVDTKDKEVNQKIYVQYLEAFEKGVYNYIRDEIDPVTNEEIPRKYFSGGTTLEAASSVLRTTDQFLPRYREFINRGQTDANRFQVAIFGDAEQELARNMLNNSSQAASPLTMKDIEKNKYVYDFVREEAERLGAGEVEIVDASSFNKLMNEAVKEGEAIALSDGNFLLNSHPQDVARVVERTFNISNNVSDKGKNNNWRSPDQIAVQISTRLTNSYTKKDGKKEKLYVIPYLLGSFGTEFGDVGFEVTNSRSVALNMIHMTKVGRVALDHLNGDRNFVEGIHSRGDLEAISRSGDEMDDRYFAAFLDENKIISYGSNYGGNVLLGKKFHSLRIASYKARKEGWLAEHMMILEIINKQNPEEKYYFAGAFPSASGKTNLAMLLPPEFLADTYEVNIIGDDIAWLRPGKDGRLYAVNPENGYFGVVPGTNEESNPRFMEAINKGGNIFTNVAFNTKTKEVWWEGKTKNFPSLEGNGQFWKDWKGQYIVERKPQNQFSKEDKWAWAHPNSRVTVPAKNMSNLSEKFKTGEPVPIDAILWGGRVSKLEPLIRQLRTPEEGVYDGAVMFAETTAAAEGEVGKLTEDYMAMKPFLSYHELDYFNHWLSVMSKLTHPPKFFHVNWFRKNEKGKFLWPGFGENLRVLLWAIDRINGKNNYNETPFGNIPKLDSVFLDGLDKTIQENIKKILLLSDKKLLKAEIERQIKYLSSLEDDAHKIPEVFVEIQNRLKREINGLNQGLTVSSSITAKEINEVDQFIEDTNNPSYTDLRKNIQKTNGLVTLLNPYLIPTLLKFESIHNSRDQVELTINGEKRMADAFFIRVAHNVIKGPAKGGVKRVIPSDLMNDKAFAKAFERLNRLNLNEEQVKRFVEKWLTQEAQFLAMGMTIKLGPFGLGSFDFNEETYQKLSKILQEGIGGGKGVEFVGNFKQNDNGQWVIEDYKPWDEMTIEELYDIGRKNSRNLAENNKIGPKTDIPAPDMRMKAADLDVKTDEYLRVVVEDGYDNGNMERVLENMSIELYDKLVSELLKKRIEESQGIFNVVETGFLDIAQQHMVDTGEPVPGLGVYTGKSDKYGVKGRPKATGEGVVDIITAYLKSKGKTIKKKTIALQGWGNVGTYFAFRAAEEEAKIIWIGDRGITLHKKSGWSSNQLKAMEKASQTLSDSGQPIGLKKAWEKGLINRRGVEEYDENTIIGADVDILTLAAAPDVININNEDQIKARLIVEGANHPISNSAEQLLANKGVVILPDVMANAGGGLVSFLETIQANLGTIFTEAEVDKKRKDALISVFNEVNKIATSEKISFRSAFYHVSMVSIIRTQFAKLLEEYDGDLYPFHEAIYVASEDTSKMTISGVLKSIIEAGLGDQLKRVWSNNVREMKGEIRGLLEISLGDKSDSELISKEIDQLLFEFTKVFEEEELNIEQQEALVLMRTLIWVLQDKTVRQQAEKTNYSEVSVLEQRTKLVSKITNLEEPSPEIKPFILNKLDSEFNTSSPIIEKVKKALDDLDESLHLLSVRYANGERFGADFNTPENVRQLREKALSIFERLREDFLPDLPPSAVQDFDDFLSFLENITYDVILKNQNPYGSTTQSLYYSWPVEYLIRNFMKIYSGKDKALELKKWMKKRVDTVKFEQESLLSSSPIDPVGGINLDPSLLNLQIKRDGNGVPLPVWDQSIEDMNIEGFFPVIINVTPIMNFQILLGLNEENFPANSFPDSGNCPKNDGLCDDRVMPMIRVKEEVLL